MAKRKLKAEIRREFWDLTGNYDGAESEFVYEDSKTWELIKDCKTLAEVREKLHEVSNYYSRIEIKYVETKGGLLP